MYKLNPHQQRQPVGGHQFFEHGTMFRGETFYEVKDKLTKFRLSNALPAGNPEQEILLHYAKHWPYMVKADREATPTEVQTLFVEWRNWITKTWRNPPRKPVTRVEAQNRWEVCLKCPFNIKKDWRETDESRVLEKRVFMMRFGFPVPQGIGFCALHKADLAVLAFSDKPVDHSSKKEGEQPAACWVL